MIPRYAGISPKGDLLLLERLGEALRGKSFLHINSTRAGGGVAEILQKLVPMMSSMGINARWDVIEGDDRFFDTTKKFHNALQGTPQNISQGMWEHHYEINRQNAAKLDLEADAVLIHDPQPVPLIDFRKGGLWFWRCHIDVLNPASDVFEGLKKYCFKYDAAVFSVSKYSRAMPLDEFIIPPSIDPLSEKNREMSDEEVRRTMDELNIPMDRPIVLQVSRFDRFKDPIGVMEAFRLVRRYNESILVLAGSAATDDPEGMQVLEEVREHAANDPDIHVLLLPPFSDRYINALQRAASVVLQKSIREGFGLTVSEAMWKGKPVIGGATGGIPLQIVHGVNGFLVYTVEGAAFRIRQFLSDPEMSSRMGQLAREHVRTNFLITRQLRDYLSVWFIKQHPSAAGLLEIK